MTHVPMIVVSHFGDVAKWSKAAVCKTAIHRFESGRRLQFFRACGAIPAAASNLYVVSAGVTELVDVRDLKSRVPKGACGFDSHPRHITRRPANMTQDCLVIAERGRLAQLVRAPR